MSSLEAKMLLLAVCVGSCTLVIGRSPASRVSSRLEELASSKNLIDAVMYGEETVEKSKRMESSIANSRVKMVKGSVSYAQLIDGYPTPNAQKQDYVAKTILQATSYFVNRFCKPQGISSYECGMFLAGRELPPGKLLGKCRNIVGFKSFDDEYRRLLPASYSDGLYEFRKSVTGSDLSHPRSISSMFHDSLSRSRQDIEHSVALVQWTQFLEHDLSKTTVQSMHDGTDIECCTSDHKTVSPRYRHPSCKPLSVSEDDTYYKDYLVTCLNYVRSALSVGSSCKFGPANQLNQASNLLDLSQLYGNHESETKPLRTNRGGKLKSQSFESTEYLMENIDGKLCATNSSQNSICYSSGDSRVNVNPYITLLHTLFLRSHNRIAKRLSLVNPHWDDDRLFQMARSVNIKIYQNIIRDWAKAVLGDSIKLETGMKPHKGESRVSNEFATAAIRFYNTMLPGEITNLVPTGRYSTFQLKDLFYKPKDLRKKEYFSHLLSSVLQQNAMSLDTSYVDDVAQLLFKTKNIGTDVLALDIQRGRDHGLSGYTSYFQLCTGRSINNWTDLSSVINAVDLETLKKAYASVHDIDLIVGAIAEKPVNQDATVGPTLSCIIKDQIAQSLDATERTNQHHKLLNILLADYSAARFLCETAQLDQVQRNIFRLPSAVDNPTVRCSQFPPLDLSALREKL
ncbi:peroxidase-like [Uranotaenia lowii]|uniref:peroxidase-like n=1 Tax=Uranotaenia lowii TaxID=190385 RepID=UPI002478A108|nr:peroxidase-like [Uranotaenia lowii]XP_055598441.1 peroxidase-like [Uranotaenia lowii]